MGVGAGGTVGGQVVAVVDGVAGRHVRRARRERLRLHESEPEAAAAAGVRRRGGGYAHLRNAEKTMTN